MSQVTVSFTANDLAVFTLPDSEFLMAINWERGADSQEASAAATGDVNRFCTACQMRLKAAVDDSSSGYKATVLWSKAAFPGNAELVQLLEDVIGNRTKPRTGQRLPTNKSTRSFAQRVETLIYALTAEPVADHTANSMFAFLASLELLAFAGTRLRPIQFWRLWRHSLSMVILKSADMRQPDPTVAGDVQLLQRGEVPFLAGILFQGVHGAAQLLKSGRKLLGQELVANTDTDGTAHANLVERLPLWLACLIRAARIGRVFDVRLWTKTQEELLRSVVERSIPLCRPDGRAALSNGLYLEPLPVLVDAAEICGLPRLGSVGMYLQSVRRVTSGKSPMRVRNDGVTLMPSNQSDFAKFALLRSDWSVQADSVALAHHRKYPQLDVTAAGRPLFHGDWSLELRIGDAPVELAEEWSCVCWQSDPDSDYMELQMLGPGKLRVERIAMLSRTKRFLLLADSISGVPHERIEYISRLPLQQNVGAKADRATREIQLTMKGFRSRAYPLAIPQDRVAGTPHEFCVSDGQLTLKQTAAAEGLFAPLIFDWDERRSRSEAQWRSLTVTEDGHVVAGGIASGHRLKVGELQLLVYRSLKAPTTGRAVLGHHTNNETVVASIQKNGDVEPILMVE